LLVDTSGSQRRVLGEERKASYTFLSSAREDKDQAFVFISRRAELLQDLTSSRKKLEAALELLESPLDRPQWGGRGVPVFGRPAQRTRRRHRALRCVLLASDELMKKQQAAKRSSCSPMASIRPAK